MAFFSGTGDRRRRMLTEQVLAASATTDRPPAAAATGGPSYTAAALDSQSRLTDFVPRRYSTIAMLFMLQTLVAAGLVALYAYLPDWYGVIAEEHRAALDLASRNSLAGWFSSVLLALTAGGSLTIYSVRRHKADDYQGRYRIWIWIAVGLALWSVTTVAGVHLVLADVLTHLTRWPTDGRTFWWWLGPAVLVVLGYGLRLSFEVSRCRFGLTVLLAAIGCWCASVAAQFGWVGGKSPAMGVMLTIGLSLAAHVLLVTSLALYSRYVVLDAGGSIPVRERKKKEPKPRKAGADSKSSTADVAGRKDIKIDAAHKSKPAPLSARRSDLASNEPTVDARKAKSSGWVDGSDDDDSYDEDDEDSGGRKLSKAERKQLRRQRTREQQADRH